MATKTLASTSAFVASHRKQPRGFGFWMFCPADKWNATNYVDYCKSYSGEYRDALQRAKRDFAAAGIRTIVVCP